ncbi:MAG: ExbD/TolR family protein [Limisphaerales bacterium]
MRRFSQRSHLVTLSEINITPLLDLAFVLLIIFVITTPLLEKGLDLKLPKANGVPDKTINPHNIRTVEISNTGVYVLDKRRMSLGQLVADLGSEYRENPNLIVYIRADADGPYRNVAALLDGCQHNGITRYSLRTEPPQP